MRTLKIAASLFVALSPWFAPCAAAWGSKGHEVIGFVADQHLSAETRAALKEICSSPSLAYIGNWADAVREDRPETAPWHYVNIPPDAAGFSAERDVPPQGCVVDRIEHFRKVLADRSREKSERLDALRWLVHLVADLHQPLHCARAKDLGGNLIEVKFGEVVTNLHAFWDTEIVEAQGLAQRDYARQLLADVRPEDLEAWRRGSLADWASESFQLALRYAYQDERGEPVASGQRLGRAYLTTRTVIVDEQLKKAAVRLAWLLNEVLK